MKTAAIIATFCGLASLCYAGYFMFNGEHTTLSSGELKLIIALFGALSIFCLSVAAGELKKEES